MRGPGASCGWDRTLAPPKHSTTQCPSHSTSGCLSEENENTNSKSSTQPTCTAAFFTTAKAREQPGGPTSGEGPGRGGAHPRWSVTQPQKRPRAVFPAARTRGHGRNRAGAVLRETPPHAHPSVWALIGSGRNGHKQMQTHGCPRGGPRGTELRAWSQHGRRAGKTLGRAEGQTPAAWRTVAQVTVMSGCGRWLRQPRERLRRHVTHRGLAAPCVSYDD